MLFIIQKRAVFFCVFLSLISNYLFIVIDREISIECVVFEKFVYDWEAVEGKHTATEIKEKEQEIDKWQT